MDKKKKTVAIIGGGPAGLTAALYLGRAGVKAVIFEGGAIGGTVAALDKIENYPAVNNVSGKELAKGFEKQALDFGAEIRFEYVTDLEKKGDGFSVYTHTYTLEADGVIIASGIKKKKLDVKGEAEFFGRGVSYCATCDGHFFKGKEVAVTGSGNAAAEEALYLSGLCSHVFLLVPNNGLLISDESAKKLRNSDNIYVLYNSRVEKIIGNERMEALEYTSESELQTLAVQALFVAEGDVYRQDLAGKLAETDDAGGIIVDSDCMTKTPLLFAAGDCVSKKLRQVVTAAADGAVAASAAVRMLK